MQLSPVYETCSGPRPSEGTCWDPLIKTREEGEQDCEKCGQGQDAQKVMADAEEENESLHSQRFLLALTIYVISVYIT